MSGTFDPAEFALTLSGQMLGIIEHEPAMPMLFVWCRADGADIRAFGMPNGSKDLRQFVGNVLMSSSALPVAGALFLSDVWTRPSELVEADGVLPRDAADAEDAVIAQWHTVNGAGAFTTKYTRDSSGQIVTGDVIDAPVTGAVADSLARLVGGKLS